MSKLKKYTYFSNQWEFFAPSEVTKSQFPHAQMSVEECVDNFDSCWGQGLKIRLFKLRQ